MGKLNFLSSIGVNKIVSGSTCVTSPITIGSACVCSPRVFGSTFVCSPVITGSTKVCSPIIIGTTCVTSPIVCASSCARSALISGTTVCGLTVCPTDLTVGGFAAVNTAYIADARLSVGGDIRSTGMISGATLRALTSVTSPILRLTNVAAKTTETCVAFFKSDGTIVSGTSTAGSGDVCKVGTPVNDQVGVWTGDGTIEGTTGLTYNNSCLFVANCARIGRCNVDADSVFVVSGPQTIAAATTVDLKAQFEQDSTTFYINENQYYSGGWNLYDSGRAPAAIKLISNNADSSITFATKAANTADPTLAMTINKNGAVIMATCADIGTCLCVGTNIILMAGADRQIFMESVGAAAQCDLFFIGQSRTAAFGVNQPAGSVFVDAGAANISSAPACGGDAKIRGGNGTSDATAQGGHVCIVGGNGTMITNPGSGVGGTVCIIGGIGDGNGGSSVCGGVNIYFGTALRINTTSTGVCVTGALTTNSTICSTAAICSNTCIDAVTCLCAGTTVTAGTCLVAATSAISPIFASASGNVALRAGAEGVVCGVANGTVALYYDNTAKICTCSTGAIIVGILCASTCGTSPDWVSTSDCRLKKDIEPIPNALSLVIKLQGVYYRLCDDETCEMNIGLIAQDVEKIIPEIVSHTPVTEEDVKDEKYNKFGITDEILGLKYDKITAILIEAIKEQQEQICYLTSEINNLKQNNTL